MKTFVLFSILAGTISAQDFHGVSIGGDIARPTIVNNSPKPVIGYATNRETTKGPVLKTTLDVEFLAKGEPMIPVGGEFAINRGPGAGFATGLPWELGEITGYSLTAVLFDDGSFIGPDYLLKEFTALMGRWRSLARDTQYRENKYQLMENDRNALLTGAEVNHHQATLAHVLLSRIRDKGGDPEAALARLASLPDVKGGQQ